MVVKVKGRQRIIRDVAQAKPRILAALERLGLQVTLLGIPRWTWSMKHPRHLPDRVPCSACLALGGCRRKVAQDETLLALHGFVADPLQSSVDHDPWLLFVKNSRVATLARVSITESL